MNTVLVTLVLCAVALSEVSAQNCQKDWISVLKRCYFFSRFKMPWSSASHHCRKMKSQLISVESDREMKAVRGYLSKLKAPGQYWTTANNYNSQLKWRWGFMKHALSVNAKYWAPGQPTFNRRSPMTFVFLEKQGLSNAVWQNWKNFICEK